MRMWMVHPRIMCRQHLLGEHKELHMLVGTLLKGTSIRGYVEKGLVDPRHIRSRHKELVDEMLRRGYNHKSPLREFDETVPGRLMDPQKSLTELLSRCSACRSRYLDRPLAERVLSRTVEE